MCIGTFGVYRRTLLVLSFLHLFLNVKYPINTANIAAIQPAKTLILDVPDFFLPDKYNFFALL